MSTNCIRCVVAKRTGFDLLCDSCRQHERIILMQDGIDTAARFMDFLRKNVGFNDDWPMELKVAPDYVDECNRLLNEFENKVYPLRTKTK